MHSKGSSQKCDTTKINLKKKKRFVEHTKLLACSLLIINSTWVRLPSHYKSFHFLPFLTGWRTHGGSKIERLKTTHIKPILFLSQLHSKGNGKPISQHHGDAVAAKCNRHLPTSAPSLTPSGTTTTWCFFFIFASRFFLLCTAKQSLLSLYS